MRSFRYPFAIIGLCLLTLSPVAAADSLSLQEGLAALPDCAVCAAHAP